MRRHKQPWNWSMTAKSFNLQSINCLAWLDVRWKAHGEINILNLLLLLFFFFFFFEWCVNVSSFHFFCFLIDEIGNNCLKSQRDLKYQCSTAPNILHRRECLPFVILVRTTKLSSSQCDWTGLWQSNWTNRQSFRPINMNKENDKNKEKTQTKRNDIVWLVGWWLVACVYVHSLVLWPSGKLYFSLSCPRCVRECVFVFEWIFHLPFKLPILLNWRYHFQCKTYEANKYIRHFRLSLPPKTKDLCIFVVIACGFHSIRTHCIT